MLSSDGTATSVTINILGTNDAAVVSSQTKNLIEGNTAADISTSGTLTVSDVDSAATFQTQTDISGLYGKFSIDANGAWTYIADQRTRRVRHRRHLYRQLRRCSAATAPPPRSPSTSSAPTTAPWCPETSAT